MIRVYVTVDLSGKILFSLINSILVSRLFVNSIFHRKGKCCVAGICAVYQTSCPSRVDNLNVTLYIKVSFDKLSIQYLYDITQIHRIATH